MILKCTFQWYFIYSQCSVNATYIKSQTFSLPQKKTLYPFRSHCPVALLPVSFYSERWIFSVMRSYVATV